MKSEIAYYLIKKYSLSKEDVDDIKSEIQISRLQYGYDRKIEHIIIDYLSKFRNYKRIGENGKRISVLPVTSSRANVENESTTQSENYFIDRSSVEEFNRSQNLASPGERKLEILKSLSTKGRYSAFILEKIIEGYNYKEIGKILMLTESRVSQLIRLKAEKAELLSDLTLKTNLSDLCKVIK